MFGLRLFSFLCTYKGIPPNSINQINLCLKPLIVVSTAQKNNSPAGTYYMSGGGGSTVHTGIICVGKGLKLFFHIYVHIPGIFSHIAIFCYLRGCRYISYKNENRRNPNIQNLYFGVLNHHAKADHMVCTWVRVIFPRATFGERFFQAQLKSNQNGCHLPLRNNYFKGKTENGQIA